jgi:hypothetical protein
MAGLAFCEEPDSKRGLCGPDGLKSSQTTYKEVLLSLP